MTYIIPGKPIPLQRARTNPHGNRPWDPQKELKSQIAMIISSQNRMRRFYEGPLELEIIFYFPATKKNGAGTWHITRPDTTNLTKLIEDAVQGILFIDDCLICSLVAKKLYAEIPRVEFVLRELII
jgi:Holliday junction resolvase RusA-like endonuclease